MVENMVEDGFEGANPVRNAGQVRVNADGHHAGIVGALLIKAGKLVDTSCPEILRGLVLDRMHDDIVGLDRIRHRNHRPVRGSELDGQVVDDPVGDVIDPGFRQKVQRLFRFRQARTFPTCRRLSGKALDGGDGLVDRPALILTRCIGPWMNPCPMNSQPASSAAPATRG